MAICLIFSNKLQPAQTRYSTFDHKLLAIYLSIKDFLEGQVFRVMTDHKPLIFPFNARPDRHTTRQCQQLDYISQFTTNLRHIQGIDNSVADALSRIEANASSLRHATYDSNINFLVMEKAQRTDPKLQKLLSKPEISSLQITEFSLYTGTLTLFCDTSTDVSKPFVSAF